MRVRARRRREAGGCEWKAWRRARGEETGRIGGGVRWRRGMWKKHRGGGVRGGHACRLLSQRQFLALVGHHDHELVARLVEVQRPAGHYGHERGVVVGGAGWQGPWPGLLPRTTRCGARTRHRDACNKQTTMYCTYYKHRTT